MTRGRQLTKGRGIATATKDASRILLLLLRLPKPAGILCAETCFMSAGKQQARMLLYHRCFVQKSMWYYRRVLPPCSAAEFDSAVPILTTLRT